MRILITWRICFLILFTMILVQSALAYGPSAYDDDLDDAEAEAEAKRDMAAFMQYTAPFRFGDDLQPGDFVSYGVVGEEGERSSIVEIEVLAADAPNQVWVHERFDGNDVRVLYDTTTHKLISLYGFDENGLRQDPPLNSDSEVEERVNEMKNMMQMIGIGLIVPSQWEQQQEPVTIRGSFGSISCSTQVPVFSAMITSKLSADELEELTEGLQLHFSDDIPKLIPTQAMFMLLSQEQLLGASSIGLAQGLGFEMINYTKTARN
ncbi:MAG: hypothetical protein K8R90_09475 [Candidatus Cloacimonetes bacterium]|nr:hypothetical protein [Candidatus Cloacimonadota bacterium]